MTISLSMLLRHKLAKLGIFRHLYRWARQPIRLPGELERARSVSEATHFLNESIRAGDLYAAKTALDAGASLQVCTFDHEGYHTPHDLAARYGQAEMQRLLKNVAGQSELR